MNCSLEMWSEEQLPDPMEEGVGMILQLWNLAGDGLTKPESHMPATLNKFRS